MTRPYTHWSLYGFHGFFLEQNAPFIGGIDIQILYKQTHLGGEVIDFEAVVFNLFSTTWQDGARRSHPTRVGIVLRVQLQNSPVVICDKQSS